MVIRPSLCGGGSHAVKRVTIEPKKAETFDGNRLRVVQFDRSVFSATLRIVFGINGQACGSDEDHHLVVMLASMPLALCGLAMIVSHGGDARNQPRKTRNQQTKTRPSQGALKPLRSYTENCRG